MLIAHSLFFAVYLIIIVGYRAFLGSFTACNCVYDSFMIVYGLMVLKWLYERQSVLIYGLYDGNRGDR